MTRNATVLIVDDDEDVLTAARLLLQRHFDRVLTEQNPAQLPALMGREAIDVYLLDMNFAIGRNSGEEGLHWLGEIRRRDREAVVVLMTAFGDLNTAVRAMRDGAADFVLKPWQNDKLLATVVMAAALRRTRRQVEALSELPPVTAIEAQSPPMGELLSRLARVAPTDATVLVRGENGTGKELIAQELHRLSPRAEGSLVSVDLGAVPENLFESELFGHRRGAFTGADTERAGRFQAAHGGTLFLDEIGNLPLALQVKLLRVLETREVTPLGGDRPVAVDVRLIAATNQPLEELVAEGEFREDLLYRINTITLALPPLRERREDIAPLARRFAGEAARKYRLAEKTFTPSALRVLEEWTWPGNVRELSHTVERALILATGEELSAEDFEFSRPKSRSQEQSLNLEVNERRLIAQALETHGGNISQAAKALGITRAALYRRIEKHRL